MNNGSPVKKPNVESDTYERDSAQGSIQDNQVIAVYNFWFD